GARPVCRSERCSQDASVTKPPSSDWPHSSSKPARGLIATRPYRLQRERTSPARAHLCLSQQLGNAPPRAAGRAFRQIAYWKEACFNDLERARLAFDAPPISGLEQHDVIRFALHRAQVNTDQARPRRRLDQSLLAQFARGGVSSRLAA